LTSEIYRISENAAFESFDDGGLILKLEDLTLTELNLTARDILHHTDGKNDVNRVAELIAAEYGIDNALAASDIRELYDDLLAQGILEKLTDGEKEPDHD